MALGKSSTKACPECGTSHSVQRGDCLPLAQRRGPLLTDPNHPANNGDWKRLMASMWKYGNPV